MDRKKVDENFQGTYIITAPEILRKEDYDEKSDCYSLGIVLFELLTNRLPFNWKNKEKFTQ